MPRRILLFDILAVIGACVFVRLGLWQLHRLTERRARNALISARLQSPAVDAAALSLDTTTTHYRRVTVTGSPDYDHELVLTARTQAGAPGVDLITPVRVPGRDSAVLVMRGWVYSPDGTTIDHAQYHEHDSTFSMFTGYVEELTGPATQGALAESPIELRQMQGAAIAKALPYPVRPFYVVAIGDSVQSAAGRLISRVGEPPLDEGPHFSYAIQWFCFATIAIVGAGVVTARSMQGEPPRDWQAT